MGTLIPISGRVPPAEAQLWQWGGNATDYGEHIWNEQSVESVGSVYAARGNPLLIDVEHLGAVTPEGEPPVTGGYARLEIRDGIPWLRFEWSDYAIEQITSGQRRYLSPEYDTKRETGEILRLYRVSLVADPGTHNARVLATAKGRPMDPTLKAALMAAISGEDPEAALASVKALMAALEDGAPGAESPAEGDAAAAPPPPAADGAPAKPKEPKPYDPQAAAADEPTEAAAEPPVPVAASAPPAPVVPRLPAKVVVPTPARIAATAGEAGAKSANARVDILERDLLIRDAGDKLTGPIRTWASSQPLEVVRQYLSALPGPLTPPAQVQPVRGGDGTGIGGQGGPTFRTKEARDRFKTTAPLPMGPVRGTDGVLRIHACCPREYRQANRIQEVQLAHAAGGK